MRKFYIMLSALISCSVFVSSCGTRPSTPSYSVASVASPTTKNCTCKKNNNTSNNAAVENVIPSSSSSPSGSPSASASASPSVSPSPEESPTPLPSASPSQPSKDKKNIFGNIIEKLKNIFKKPSK